MYSIAYRRLRGILPMMLFFGRLVQWPHCDGRGRTPRSGFLLGFRLSSRIMMTMLGTVTSRKRKRSSVGRLFGQFLGFLGDAVAAWPRLLSLSLLFGPGFGFCGTTVMARSPGCPGSVGRRDSQSLQTQCRQLSQ